MNNNLYQLLFKLLEISLLILLFNLREISNASAAGSCSINGNSSGGACIAANDFGLGGTIYVPANPDEGMTISTATKLLRSNPKKQQIAPWIDSGLYTLGNPPDPKNPNRNNLRLTITGCWNPWGGSVEGLQVNDCELLDCSTAKKEDRVCLPGGKVVNRDINKLPCILRDGWGLYGLIAVADSGGKSYSDPNELSAAINLPKSLFRTFRVAPTVKGSKINSSASDELPEYEYYFELDATEICDESGCKKDVHREGGEYVMRGRLFFKMQDGYYQDNTGGYNITITNGVYTEKGFIESTIDTFSAQIDKVTKSLYNSMVRNTQLIAIVRTLLLLYVVITGIMFALGTIRASQRELIVILFKFSVVATLISDQSWDFFNTYLFELCKGGAKDIADVIIRSTLFYDGDINSPIYYLPDKSSPLTVYDIVLKMLTKLPVHAKTLSLLFYDWKLYWIPCVYVGFYFIIVSILKSMMLYLLMLIQVALLLIVAPIFIMMLLFKITKELFDIWIKQVIGTAILYIMIAASIALMVKLIFSIIQTLLWFRVCWQTVWKLEILGFTIIDLKFWYPESSSELLMAINPTNFFAYLLIAVIFFSLMDNIPQMVDLLVGQTRGALKNMFDIGMVQWQKSFINHGIQKGRALAKHGTIAAISALDGGVTAKVVDTVNRGADTIKGLVKNFDKAVGEDQQGDGIDEAFKTPRNWIAKDGKASGSGSSRSSSRSSFDNNKDSGEGGKKDSTSDKSMNTNSSDQQET